LATTNEQSAAMVLAYSKAASTLSTHGATCVSMHTRRGAAQMQATAEQLVNMR